jgi:protein-disulfide isomerase
MKKFYSFLLILFLAAGVAAQAKNNKDQKPATKEAVPQSVVEKKADDCGCEPGSPPDTFATVDGVKISPREIDDSIRPQLLEVRTQLADARNRALRVQIDSRLIEAEARKRAITPQKLIEQEVVSKMTEPTEGEALSFYTQNKDRLQGAYRDLKPEIIKYLRDERREEGIRRLADRLRLKTEVKILVEDVIPPSTDAERKRPLATIAGVPLTAGDVEEALRPVEFEARERIYELRKAALDVKINNLLLNQEAEKRKVSPDEVLRAEVSAKMKPVTEEDSRAFYDQNRQNINAEFAQVKDQIADYLQKLNQQKRETDFVAELRKSAAIRVYLALPEAPFYNISTDDQPSKGNAAARVTLIEFTDFQCPSCAKFHPVLDKLMKEYGDRVRLVVRDFPLEMHKHAMKAAEAAEAAREQGKYWEFISVVFDNQSALEAENLKEYASRVGLDRKAFDEALDTGKFREKVQRDLQDGARIGVTGTPTLFINGRRARDTSLEALKAAIEAALKEEAKKSQ